MCLDLSYRWVHRAISCDACTQVEGAFIQGLGYLTSEEVVVDEKTGQLITDGTWTYKIPAASCIPQQMNVEFLKASPWSLATRPTCLALTSLIITTKPNQAHQLSSGNGWTSC